MIKQINIQIAAVLYVACSLASCAVGPDYKKPDISLPGEFTQKDSLKDINENLDEHEELENWWDSFNDPFLTELISRSTSTNLTVLQAVERIEQARAATRQTFFGLFPTPTVTSQFLRSKIAGVRFPGIASNGIQFELYSAGLEANWEIDFFGRIRRAIESNESLAIGTAFSLDDSIRLIQAQIATAYIQLRGAQLQRKLTAENIRKQREILALIEKRHEVGEYSPFDLERARALTARTESMLSQFDALISVNIHRIAALSGEFSADLIDELKLEKDLPEYHGTGIISSPEQLIRRRPDVRVAEQSLHAATADIGVAMADLFPQVSIVGSVSQEGRSPSDWFGNNSDAYAYGPRISWSILNLGAIINNIKSRRARTRELLLRYKEVIVITLEEVENAITELSLQLERSSHLERAYLASSKALEIAEIRYREGIINYIDLLSAQQELLDTESELTDSRTRKSLAYISLYRAFAGSWKADEEQDTAMESTPAAKDLS
jgi:outer membrane protein, multidrug efflux system